MTSRDFCYWLQGYFEITGADDLRDGLTGDQVELVQRHLALVFKHEIDPSMGPPEKQIELNKIHAPEPKLPPIPPPSHVGGDHLSPGSPHNPHGVIMRC